MELNQNRSLDNLALWLTSPYSVANIQKFFGIRKLKSNEIDDGDEQQGGKGVTSNGIGSGLSDHGSPWRSRLKDAAENHQQHVDYVVDNWLWYGIFRIGALLGDDVFYYTFMPFWFYNVNGIVMRKVALIWAIVMYVGQTSKEVSQIAEFSSVCVDSVCCPSFHNENSGISCLLVCLPGNVTYASQGQSRMTTTTWLLNHITCHMSIRPIRMYQTA